MSLGGSAPSGNTTTTQEPASYMLPYISNALSGANSLYGYAPQYYQGNLVAGFSDPQQQAFSGINDLATNPGLDAAKTYNQNLLTGNFIGPEAGIAAMGQGGATNPFLDATFQQAAGATQNQLASEFAGGGRNVGASQAARGQQLNNLATDIYGGAYQQDQNRALAANQTLGQLQNEAVNNSQNLDKTQLGLLNAQMGVGSQIQDLAQANIAANQQKYNYYQQLPIQQLQTYEGLLGGVQPGMQTSQPYFQNNTANTLGSLMAMQQLYKGFGGWPSSSPSSFGGDYFSSGAGLDNSGVNWNMDGGTSGWGSQWNM